MPARRRRFLKLSYALTLAAGALALILALVATEALLLPNASARHQSLLPVASAAPVPAARSISAAAAEAAAGAFALLSRADSDSLPARPPSLSFEARAAPNISVVVPCYGHVPYLEQTLMSVVTQRYPPAEILVLDDGSEERCGDAAAAMLRRPALARPRRRQVLTLVGWWGWSSADLARFEDEVVVTPNRGVAHARNAGIRRARGDWIMCLDGDDTVSDSYLMRAMEQVALVPRTNLVYANQQFFDGSRWQWTVPPLRADNALVNGPLPLMTLWRKDLWLATPHGFDEALPKGHEDWAFWLQLTRLPLLPHKLDDFLTQYRYKKDSKMRTRERNNPEAPRLPRLHERRLPRPSLEPSCRYPVRKLLIDHHELLKPAGEPGQKPGITEAVVMDVSVSQHLHPTRPEPHLWSGMILQAKGDLAGAAAAYNASAALAAPYDWQGSYRLWRALLLLGDGAAAAREEAALRRRWGDAQMRWYSTDAYGGVLPAASE
ncbi:hypothetical protein EMIHUDRAFT_461437 [Emiliania huxleyi CCMP1516]|uniref:Glycosyltransferase 2-like domain-containing protein n=2 Tax=Emiliania huxleyi TaxID=2903 RepID=A0A0D3J4F7_EMIH1|nr:hypothetical protein EMIHUDRAFT_461437 [Emiliania huxleyi CCMP1516]EOD18392.1 hypothetical protein EMIHUDRAFT_461437 [Emiliania huxleyi CCMP1516]|eukprot:XP_005770821.1 hypothetical protein EMIHUDRAFT_461437 [Emiliania huxleyi CCMP1516]